MKNDTYEFILEGLECANCANKIQTTIAKDEKFSDVIVNFNTTKLMFKTTYEGNIKKYVEEVVKKIEPDVKVLETENTKKEKTNYTQVINLILGIILIIFSFIFKSMKEIYIILAYITLLYRTFNVAVKKIFKNRVLDENTLITISVVGAYLVGEHMEGLMVILLYEIGKILEARAVNKSRKSIKSLMDIRPKYANLKIGNDVKVVKPEDVKVNDLILVKTGEEIPLDGIVSDGETQIDTSTLTGESIPREVKPGDEVLSGSINIQGLIVIKVTKEYKNSTVYKMLELVENATDRKAKTENFVSKAARIYTPTVLILAMLVAIFMPMIIKEMSYSESIYRALIFLVISCPCAMAISVPLSYFSGIGRASKSGILIKGSNFLDNLRDIKTIVFDKTGTITTGSFNIHKINSLNDKYTEEDILKICAIGESFSNHPIAKAVLKKYGKEIDTSNVSDYKEISGRGISYKLGDDEIIIGNAELVGVEAIFNKGTVLYISINKKLSGEIIIKDEVKNGAKEVIDKLKKLNINTKMFTGDNETVAQEVAKKVGIEDVSYKLLPEDKYNKLEEILKIRDVEKEKVSFVGDGINDSPVLALSDVGISMGGIGSSSAIESSDIVIMTDELNKIIEAIEISKKTNRIIKQNLTFAIGTKVLFLILSLLRNIRNVGSNICRCWSYSAYYIK